MTAELTIRCPNTGERVGTKMWMDRAAFERSSITNATSRCSACGERHTWSKAGAQVGF